MRFALGGGVVEKTAYLPSPALVDDFYDDDENATAARSRSRSRCTGGDETTWSLADDITRKNNTTTTTTTNNTNEFRRRRQREEGELASKALSNNDAFGGEGDMIFFPSFPSPFLTRRRRRRRDIKKKDENR